MRLTVLEFSERYRIREADASKLLRRAALGGRLEVSYDDSYKATYTGSPTRFDQLAGLFFVSRSPVRRAAGSPGAARLEENETALEGPQ